MRYSWETWAKTVMANSTDVINAVNWTEWVMVPGPAPEYARSVLNFTNADEIEARDLADAYISLGGASSPSNYQDYFKFYANQKVIFCLELIIRQNEMDLTILKKIDNDLNMT